MLKIMCTKTRWTQPSFSPFSTRLWPKQLCLLQLKLTSRLHFVAIVFVIPTYLATSTDLEKCCRRGFLHIFSCVVLRYVCSMSSWRLKDCIPPLRINVVASVSEVGISSAFYFTPNFTNHCLNGTPIKVAVTW